MSVGEFIRNVAVWLLGAALFVACGILVFQGGGAHAANDYINKALGFTLIGLGILTAGFGAFSFAGIYYEERMRRRDEQLRVTPRQGTPSTPPAWGMGNVGRIQVSEKSVGKGGTRAMSVAVNNLDAPIFVVALLVWTVVAVILFAPK